MHAIRWFFLLPLTACAWYLVFFSSMSVYAYVDSNLCPPGDLVSGMCTNDVIVALDILTHFGVGLSAMAVLVVSSAVAPSHKQVVLWMALLAGLVVAAVLGALAAAWSLFIAAAAGGAIGAKTIASVLRRHAANNSSTPRLLRGSA